MNKTEFLRCLQEELTALPPEDLQQWLDDYSELIDDRMEDGVDESAAVAAFGDPADVAQQILTAAGLSTAAKRPQRQRSFRQTLWLYTSPVWVPLIAAALITAAAGYISLWFVGLAVCVTLFSLLAVDLALATSALVSVLAAGVFFSTGHPAQALLTLGMGLICAAACLVLALGLVYAVRGTRWCLRWMVRHTRKFCLSARARAASTRKECAA